MCGMETSKCKIGGGVRRKQLNYSQKILNTQGDTKTLGKNQATQGKQSIQRKPKDQENLNNAGRSKVLG
jgi:hypothetical protein